MSSVLRLFLLCLCAFSLLVADAFAPTLSNRASTFQRVPSFCQPTTSLQASPLVSAVESSTTSISATTLDPTTLLSDLLGGFVSSNLILAVPIVAALAIASLVAFGIVSYANPAEPDED